MKAALLVIGLCTFAAFFCAVIAFMLLKSNKKK